MSARVAIGLAFACVSALSGAACDSESGISPVPASSSTTTGSGGAAPDGGAAKRSVITRSPYGNVAHTKNLLWDGDFEWLSPFADQYGWLPATTSGFPQINPSYGVPDSRLGASCASGVRCVVLRKNRGVLGLGVASAGHELFGSVRARATTCADVRVYLFTEDNGEPWTELPASAERDADGFCVYQGVAAERTSGLYFYAENRGDDEALVDDAIVEAAPDAGQSAATAPHLAPAVLDWAAIERLDRLRADVRALLRPHDAPPNEAERRFREHMGKKR